MIAFDISTESKSRQQSLVLQALQAGPVTTAFSREMLGIWHLAGRVHDLKKLGHRIETEMVKVFDAAGRPHRSASYTLRGEL